MVLDSGSIIELDSPQKLLADKNSAFFSLASSMGIATVKSWNAVTVLIEIILFYIYLLNNSFNKI